MGAGLVDNKKAKAIKQAQRKQKKQQQKAPKGQQEIDENKLRLERERLEKVERDRELNRQREAQVQERAIAAQIKQLIESNRIEAEQDDVGYQFADGKKIQKIYISSRLVEQLSRGQLSIAKLEDRYHLIPNGVAEKIAQRNADAIIPVKVEQDQVSDDDPYADYKIPDDLMW